MNPLSWCQEHSLLLEAFWKRVAYGNKRWRSKLPRRDTLAILKKYAKLDGRGDFKPNIAKIREKFNHVKTRRHSLYSHSLCFCCGNPAVLRHHIIPIKNGGYNHKRNIISLCQQCHEFIHPWMREQPNRK